jgi:hypothetical protein
VVFINDFGPLAASVFEAGEPVASGPPGPSCLGFTVALDRPGLGVSRSVMPGFFRIAKSIFSKIASGFANGSPYLASNYAVWASRYKRNKGSH